MSNVYDFATGQLIEGQPAQYRMLGVDPVIDFVIQARDQIGEILIMVNLVDGQQLTLHSPMTMDKFKVFALDLMADAMGDDNDEE